MPAEFNGWHLPDGDGYFSEFVNGQANTKVNGFQRHHLLTAFEHVKHWGIALDVGAHVGFWTLDMAERFERVVALEPSPSTFACLKQNMAEFENVELINAAAGEQPMRCSIKDDESRSNNTGSRFVAAGTDVEMVTLDSLKLPGCDFMKIDVEGYELQVLRGARRLITNYWPVIIMETDKRFSRRYLVQHGAAEKHLLDLGYKVVAHMRPDKVFKPK